MSGVPRPSFTNQALSGGYDANLANASPALTKGQIQEGYDPNLLTTPLMSPPPPSPLHSTNHGDLEDRHAGGVPCPPQEHLPFWKTSQGITLIILMVLLVTGAVVGSVVGGVIVKRNIDARAAAAYSATAIATFPVGNPATVSLPMSGSFNISAIFPRPTFTSLTSPTFTAVTTQPTDTVVTTEPTDAAVAPEPTEG